MGKAGDTMQNDQMEWLRDEIIRSIQMLDYCNLKKLSVFIADLASVEVRNQEREGGKS